MKDLVTKDDRRELIKGMCPHCGEIFPIADGGNVPIHATGQRSSGKVCPGSQQHWRNPDSDARALWNGKPNMHLISTSEDNNSTDRMMKHVGD